MASIEPPMPLGILSSFLWPSAGGWRLLVHLPCSLELIVRAWEAFSSRLLQLEPSEQFSDVRPGLHRLRQHRHPWTSINGVNKVNPSADITVPGFPPFP